MNDEFQSPPQKDDSVPWRLPDWFKDIDTAQMTLLKQLFDELVKFNRTINLISPKTVPVADILHFSDSILASRLIFQDNKLSSEIFDLGSGNGFPGLVFAILNPSSKVVLVDSDERKTEYLKHCVNILRLSNCRVLNTQVEKLPPESITLCMSRGFSSISKSILMVRKMVIKGGAYYHLKSDAWSGEVSEIPTQLCSVWSPSLVGEYRLPVGSAKFAVVKTLKIA